MWTCGYGHVGHDVYPGHPWTQQQAEDALDSDLARFTAGVKQMLSAPLTDNQFSALVIFAFNVGLIALHGSTALHDIQIGRLEYVPADLALWNKIHDRSGVLVVDAGLVKRRNAEIALWSTP